MVQQISVHELDHMLKAGEPVYLVDVRHPWEHDIAALPNSRLIPLDQLAQRAGEISNTDGTTIVVYCHHGIRSLSGAALLQQHGFVDVASLAGGIDAWSLRIDAGVPRY